VANILAIIPNDHDHIKGIYKMYRDPTDSAEQREKLLNELLSELVTHMTAEEAVVYPAVADQVEEHMRDHAMDEHESLKLFTADLKGMKPGQEGYEDKVHQLMETFLEHIHEEEHKMLPALRDTLTEAQLLELGKRFEQAKSQLQPSI
jgi:hemerythrin superfamily protein